MSHKKLTAFLLGVIFLISFAVVSRLFTSSVNAATYFRSRPLSPLFDITPRNHWTGNELQNPDGSMTCTGFPTGLTTSDYQAVIQYRGDPSCCGAQSDGDGIWIGGNNATQIGVDFLYLDNKVQFNNIGPSFITKTTDGAWHTYTVTKIGNTAQLLLDGNFLGAFAAGVNAPNTMAVGGSCTANHSNNWNNFSYDVSFYDVFSGPPVRPVPTATPTPKPTPTPVPTPPAPTPTPQPTAAPSCTISENFNSMPNWNYSWDADWGNSAIWITNSYLRASRSGPGSSSKVKVYSLSPNTSYKLQLKMLGLPGNGYWTESAYKFGNNSAQDFDDNASSWTLVNKFSDSGPYANGNGGTWTSYTKSLNTDSNTSISIGFKAGSVAGSYPGGNWDELSLCR